MTENDKLLEKKISLYTMLVLGPETEHKKMLKKSFDNFWRANICKYKKKSKGKNIFPEISAEWRKLSEEEKIMWSTKNVDKI